MKELYLLRHGHTKPDGHLMHASKKAAEELRESLPLFQYAYCSNIEAAALSAQTLANMDPTVKEELGYYFPDPAKERLLFSMMHQQNISYLDAVNRLGDPQFKQTIDARAKTLNEFIDERLNSAKFNSALLLVTDAVIIGEAMLQRGVSLELIPYLRGYIIKENGTVARFEPGVEHFHSGI